MVSVICRPSQRVVKNVFPHPPQPFHEKPPASRPTCPRLHHCRVQRLTKATHSLGCLYSLRPILGIDLRVVNNHLEEVEIHEQILAIILLNITLLQAERSLALKFRLESESGHHRRARRARPSGKTGPNYVWVDPMVSALDSTGSGIRATGHRRHTWERAGCSRATRVVNISQVTGREIGAGLSTTTTGTVTIIAIIESMNVIMITTIDDPDRDRHEWPVKRLVPVYLWAVSDTPTEWHTMPP